MEIDWTIVDKYKLEIANKFISILISNSNRPIWKYYIHESEYDKNADKVVFYYAGDIYNCKITFREKFGIVKLEKPSWKKEPIKFIINDDESSIKSGIKKIYFYLNKEKKRKFINLPKVPISRVDLNI